HLDLSAGDELDMPETQVVELGATRAEMQPHPDRWRVLIDPAGHPFCITTVTPPPTVAPVSAGSARNANLRTPGSSNVRSAAYRHFIEKSIRAARRHLFECKFLSTRLFCPV